MNMNQAQPNPSNQAENQAKKQAKDEKQTSVWICVHCIRKKCFERISALYSHYANLHSRLRIECGICNNRFKTVTAREIHIATTHWLYVRFCCNSGMIKHGIEMNV